MILAAWGVTRPGLAHAEEAESAAPSFASGFFPWTAEVAAARRRLAETGVQTELSYTGEVMGVASGGLNRTTKYNGLFRLDVDADLSKLTGWRGGAFHASALQINGDGFTGENIGAYFGASNIEALPSTRLFELWFEQKLLDDRLSIRAGQLAADGEFATSEYGGLYLNGAFGWPGLMAANLPNGGPAYPLAVPGARVQVDPTPQYSFLAGVFNGDPAAHCDGDSQKCNPDGLDFPLDSPDFVIAEQQFKYNQGKEAGALPGVLKIGGWKHFGRFDDLRHDAAGAPLAATGGDPERRNGDYGFYGVIEQQLYQAPGAEAGKGAGLFARFATAPEDRNAMDFYVDGGLNFTGLIPHRPDDSFGVAVAYGRMSNSARRFDRDLATSAGLPLPIRDCEVVLEVTYQAQIAPGWTIQPDFQYIISPGGHVADPDDPSGLVSVSNAVVIGARVAIKY
jgi:porin